MLIFLRQNNGNGYQLQLSQHISVQQMFFQLSQFYNQKPLNYNFFCKGHQLTNLKTSLLDLKIGNNSIIYIQKKDQLAASTNSSRQIVLNLSIFSYQNQTIVVNLPSNDTVLKIKHKVYEHLKIHPKSQTLIFQGRKLQDNMSLKQTNLKNNSMISMIVNRKQSFKSYIEQHQHQFLQSPQLLQSITSLHHKSNLNSKTSLFRSDSLNKKYAQTERIQVQIRQRKIDFIDLGASVESNMDIKYKCMTPNRMQKQLMKIYNLNGLQEEEQICFQNEQQQISQERSAYRKLQIALGETPNLSESILSHVSQSQQRTFSKISNDKLFDLSMNPELSKIDHDYQDLHQNIRQNCLQIGK